MLLSDSWAWPLGSFTPWCGAEGHVVVISQVTTDEACPSPPWGDEANPPTRLLCPFHSGKGGSLGLVVQRKETYFVCFILAIRSVSPVLCGKWK